MLTDPLSVISGWRALGLSFPSHPRRCRLHCEAFSEELIRPGSPQTGAAVATETGGPAAGRMGCPEAEESRRSSDLLSRPRELSTFHLFLFHHGVPCAGVKTLFRRDCVFM